MSAGSISRRALLRGAPVPPEVVNRPPWTKAESLSRCTSCNACIAACPEHILAFDVAGIPYIDFSVTGCTFCGDCAAACEEGVFGPATTPPWQIRLDVSANCLLQTGVSCQLCTDFCDVDALRFDLSQRPVGALHVDNESCTGCGMCVGACPVKAISIEQLDAKETA